MTHKNNFLPNSFLELNTDWRIVAFGKMQLGHVLGKAHGPRSNQVTAFLFATVLLAAFFGSAAIALSWLN